MKRNNWLTLGALAVLVVVVLVACGGGKNTVTIAGETYELGQAIVEDWGENTGSDQSGYDIDLYLLGPEIDMVEQTGSGAGIYLDLNSTEETLSAGTYEYGDERTSNTLYDAEVFVGDLGEDEPDVEFEAEAGSVEIKVNGDTYTIDFTLSDEEGTEVNGNYTGELVAAEDQ